MVSEMRCISISSIKKALNGALPRKLLSLMLALCMMLGMLPAVTASASAEEARDGQTDVPIGTGSVTIFSYMENDTSTRMSIMVTPNRGSGNPTITMKETTGTGANDQNQPYQYSSSNGFASVTAKALTSGAEGVTDPEDPAYWKTPGISFTGEGSAAYTQSGSVTNVESATISTSSIGTLFAPSSITRIFTEDLINNKTGAAGSDGRADVIGVVGTAPGQPNIQVTWRVRLMKNSVTGVVNMSRYTVEATNTSPDQAYAYGLSWNVDTYIGNSYTGWSGDAAQFQAPSLNRFSAGAVAFRFPNPGGTPWSAYLTPGAYADSVPKYLYACHPDPNNSFTAVIYPGMSTKTDGAYPGATFQTPDFLGMGSYSTIMTTSAAAYYYWKTFNGTAPLSSDSGHIVRYDPRLLLPGQQLYFGVDYGQGLVGQAAEDDPYLQVDMWNDVLPANAQKTGYDGSIEPNLTYGNANSVISFTNAAIQMELDKRYLQPNASMTTGAGPWVLISDTGNIQTWQLDLGALPAGSGDASVGKAVRLDGIPVYTADTPTDVTFRLVTTPEYGGNQDLMTVTKTVTLEKCNPLTMTGTVWRDINDSGAMESFEGVRNIPVELYTETGGAPVLTGTATSIGGGAVTGPNGISTGVRQFVTIGALTGDNQRYTLSGISLKVNGVERTLSTPVTAGDNDPIFETLSLTTVNGKQALSYKLRNGVAASLEYAFELGNKSVLLVRPYAPDGASDPYSEAKKVEAGSYRLTINGNVLSNAPIGSGDVPVRAEVAAGSDVVAYYNTPLGYRHPDGSMTASRTEYNVTSWYPSSTEIPLDFPLVGGDIRLNGITAAGGAPTQAATDVETACSSVSLPLSLWSGKTAQLDIRAWNNTGEIADPVRTGYSWTIVDDPSGLLASITADTGMVTFQNTAGSARVRVTNNALPAMYHEMVISLAVEQETEYARIYLADAAMGTLTPLTETTVAVGAAKNVYLVGELADGTKEKIRNTSTASFTYGSSGLITVTPAAGADGYLYQISGVAAGYTGVTPGYGGAVAGATNVLVTNQPITASTRLEIAPDPVEGAPGARVSVLYWLRFGGSGAHDQSIPAEAVNASLGGAAVAALISGGASVDFLAIGSDTLTAALKCDASKTDAAAVHCKTSVGPVTGSLGIVERSSPAKGGFIEAGSSANYSAYIDVNGDGGYDAGDLVLDNSEVSWTVDNGSTVAPDGTHTDQVKVTGGPRTGPAKLAAVYVSGGVTYTASADILVYAAGYSMAGLEVTPAYSSIDVNGTRTFSVKAVFRNAANSEERYVLPESMFTSWTALPSAADTADTSILKLEAGGKSTVKGVAPGQALFVARVTQYPQHTAQGHVLVVPGDAVLTVTPTPIWAALSGQASVSYALSAPAVSEADLLPYLTANLADQSVAAFDGGIKAVKGLAVGRTTLSASLTGLPRVSCSANVYVYDASLGGGTIAFSPNTLELSSGAQGSTQVRLMNTSGQAVASVDLGDLALAVGDSGVATIPANPTGTTLTVTAADIELNGSTTVTATIPGTSLSADLTVKVTGSGAGTVNGLSVLPAVIELWPGETKQVSVTDTLTGQPLNAAMLQMLTKTFGDSGASNTVAVDAGSQKLVVGQTTGMAPGVNTLTVSMDGKSATVTILNFSENPYDGNHSLSLKAEPDPAGLVKDGPAKDVRIKLILTDTATAAQVDAIEMPAALLTWRANTESNLPGALSVAASAAAGQTLSLTGLTAGAAAYRVTYVNGRGENVSTAAHAFVFAQDPTSPALNVEFRFVPDYLVLNVGQTANIRGVITYEAGGSTQTQTVRAAELPYAVPDLAISLNQNVASVSATGAIKGLGTAGAPAAESMAEGTLLGTALRGETAILVVAAGAAMRVEPDPIVLTTGETQYFHTVLEMSGTPYIVPNRYLSYAVSNGKATIAEDMNYDAAYTIEGVSEGTAALTATLAGTNRSAAASVVVLTSATPGDFGEYALRLTPNPRLVAVGGSAPFYASLLNLTSGQSVSVATNWLAVDPATTANSIVDPATGNVTGLSMGYDLAGLSLSRTVLAPGTDTTSSEEIFNGEMLVIIHGNGSQTIEISPDPVEMSAPNQAVSGVVTYNGEMDATVLWISSNPDVAVLDGGVMVGGKSVKMNDAIQSPASSTADLTWTTENNGTLQAYVLESGASDTVALLRSPVTINAMTFAPDMVSMFTGDLKSMDELANFSIDITTDHGLVHASLADFDIVSGGEGTDAALMTSGLAADQVLRGAHAGATDLVLQYRYAGNAASYQKTVTVYVRPASPVEIRFYAADGTTRLYSLSLAVGESKTVIPKYYLTDGTEVEIPNDADAPVWTIGSNAAYSTSAANGMQRLTISCAAPYSDRLDGSKTTTYGSPGPNVTLTATGSLPIQIRNGDLTLSQHAFSASYRVGDTASAIAGNVTDGAYLVSDPGAGVPAGLCDATIVGGVPDTAPNTFVGTYGKLLLNSNGTFTYTPNASLTSAPRIVADVFTYQVRNGAAGEVAQATMTFTFHVSSTVPPAAYTISGRVTDTATGLPLSGVSVSMAGQTTATTDAAGGYSFAATVADGTYSVTANGTGVGYNTVILPVTVNGANVTNADFQLTASSVPPANFIVSGKVTNRSTGAGISGAAVAMSGQTAVTAADGSYTFAAPVAAGTYTVSASAAGYTSGSLSIHVSANYPNANLSLSASGGGGGGGGGGGETTVSYTLSFDSNGGTSVASITKPKGTTVQLTQTPTRNDYTFDGWYSDSELTQKIVKVTLERNTTVYAKWTRSGEGTVDWNKSEHFAYIVGYDDGLVHPTANVTRAQVATIFFRLMTETSRDHYFKNSNDFGDVGGGAWFNDAVSTIANAGLIVGYTDGTFGPDRPITRAEFAAIAVRANGGDGLYTGGDKFSDISGSWASGYINQAAEMGLITGYTDGTFRPNAYLTRAETITIVNRFLGRDKVNASSLLPEMKTFGDNLDPTAWYYYGVQEAANGHDFTLQPDNTETWTRLQ